MAGQKIADNSSFSPQDLQALLGLVKGSSTSSTTSSNISQDGINSMLQDILSSSQGLASISSGQVASGLYKSTTNQLLTNNLETRVAGELAQRQAGTTTTQKKNAMLSPENLVSLLGSAAVSKIAGPTVKAAGNKLGVNQWGDKLKSAIFGDDAAGGTAMGDSAGTLGAADSSAASQELGLSAADLVGADVGSTTAMGSAAGILGGADSATVGADATADGVADGVASDAAVDAGADGVADAAIGAGAVAGGAVAAGAADTGVAGLVAEFAPEIVAWIVCTELYKQGKMPKRFYIYGNRKFARYDEYGKQGYYYWAIPTVQYLRKSPNSKLSKIIRAVMVSRAEYISAQEGCTSARKTILGFISNYALYAISWILSRTVARKPIDWSVVYGRN